MIGISTLLLTHWIFKKQTMHMCLKQNMNLLSCMLLQSTSSRLAKVINFLSSLKKPTQANKVPKDGNRRLCNNKAGAGLFYLNSLKIICLKQWGLRITFHKHILDEFLKKNKAKQNQKIPEKNPHTIAQLPCFNQI